MRSAAAPLRAPAGESTRRRPDLTAHAIASSTRSTKRRRRCAFIAGAAGAAGAAAAAAAVVVAPLSPAHAAAAVRLTRAARLAGAPVFGDGAGVAEAVRAACSERFG